MMWDGGSWGGGWWIVMWISMVLFWGGIIAVAVWLVGGFGRGGWRDGQGGGGGRDTPEETLARRLASGEIDQEQYRALRDELRGGHPGPHAPAH